MKAERQGSVETKKRREELRKAFEVVPEWMHKELLEEEEEVAQAFIL